MKENAKQTQHWQEMSKVAKYFIQCYMNVAWKSLTKAEISDSMLVLSLKVNPVYATNIKLIENVDFESDIFCQKWIFFFFPLHFFSSTKTFLAFWRLMDSTEL